MPPPDLVALRFTVAGIAMLPWLLRYGLGGLSWSRILTLSFLAGPCFALAAFYGFVSTPAAHGAALMPGTLPLWTVVLAAIVIGERINATKIAGVVLTIGGIAAISGPDFASANLRALAGDLLFPLASFAWAVYTVLARLWGVSPMRAAAIVFVFGAAMWLPIYLAVWGPRVLAAPPADLLIQGIYQGLISTIVSIVLYMRAVRALGAGPTTLVTAAVPGVVTLAAIPLLGESPTPLTILGIVLVSAGVVATVAGVIQKTGSGRVR
jgi:drug/metabolite transporter (DMT)-like permease